MKSTMQVFVIDDERIIRVTIADDLRDAGFKVYEFSNAKIALMQFKEICPDIVISDIKMPEMDGVDFFEKARQICPDTIFILMTAYGKIEDAVKVIKLGAFDYLTKPFSNDELMLKIEQAKKFNFLRKENSSLKSKLFGEYDFSKYIGVQQSIENVFNLVNLVAQSNSTVLLIGETGTGKELVTNIIHFNSLRKNKPLIKVSCAILAREIFESELFGHEKGSFTGAEGQKIGRFERANEGTLYLDDIDDMPLDLQVKLLRVLEENEIERVGGSEIIKIDVRIIASTKADLLKLVNEGKFREDLYYRLNVFPIQIPPLRERKEDIKVLVESFIAKNKKTNVKIEKEALEVLEKYSFPGNVRELRNLVERLVLLAGNNNIMLKHLPYEIVNDSHVRICPQIGEKPLDEMLNEFEENIIKHALQKNGNNKTKAAEMLGIPVSTLRSKIEKLNI